MAEWRFSVPKVLVHDGLAVTGQVLAVLALLAAAALWLLDRIFGSQAQALIEAVLQGLLVLALVFAVMVAFRVLALARVFSRALIVRAEAVPVHGSVRWLPLGHRTRYPLRVWYEVEGDRHTCDVHVHDAAVYQRIEREGFVDVVVDPQAHWEIYAADLYLERTVTRAHRPEEPNE